MPRGNQVTRHWRLIQLLERSRGGLTFEDLARELGCTARTVMRDLDHIQAVGFPVTEDRDGKEKRWKLVEGYRSDLPVPLSLSELMALYFSRSLLKPLHGTPFHSALESAIAKIRALLPPEGHGFLDQIEGTVTTRGPAFKDYTRMRGVLEAITTARLELTSRRTCMGASASFGGRRPRFGSISAATAQSGSPRGSGMRARRFNCFQMGT